MPDDQEDDTHEENATHLSRPRTIDQDDDEDDDDVDLDTGDLEDVEEIFVRDICAHRLPT